jgi:hypothetical protein
MNLILAIILIWLSFSFGILFGAIFRRRPRYNGVINVTATEDKIIYSLELNHPAEDLQDMHDARFEIKPLVGPHSQGNHGL